MELGEEAVAGEIAKCVAHLFFARGDKASTVEGKLEAVFSSPSRNRIADEAFYIKSVKAGIATESALKEEPQQSISCFNLKQGLLIVSEWGEGSKLMWLMLAVSFFFRGSGV